METNEFIRIQAQLFVPTDVERPICVDLGKLIG